MALRAIPLIERATHAVALRLAGMEELDVNQPEAHVLAYLKRPKKAPLNEIHAEFGHKRSTLTSVLDRLERRGLIRRQPAREDRRGVVVALTPSGEALAARVHGALRRFEDSVLNEFSERELSAFGKVLAAFGRPRALE